MDYIKTYINKYCIILRLTLINIVLISRNVNSDTQVCMAQNSIVDVLLGFHVISISVGTTSVGIVQPPCDNLVDDDSSSGNVI